MMTLATNVGAADMPEGERDGRFDPDEDYPWDPDGGLPEEEGDADGEDE